MEILDQLQTKVRNAVQKIEELQNRVNELEQVKRQYEEKMQGLVQEIGDIGSSSDTQGDENSSQQADSSEGETKDENQDGGFNHQY